MGPLSYEAARNYHYDSKKVPGEYLARVAEVFPDHCTHEWLLSGRDAAMEAASSEAVRALGGEDLLSALGQVAPEGVRPSVTPHWLPGLAEAKRRLLLTECENATSAVADSIRGAAEALVDVRRMKDEVGGRWGDFLTAITPALFVLIDERARQDMHAKQVDDDAAVEAEADAYMARVYAREGIKPPSHRKT